MDDAKQKQWWELHARLARGETLEAAEQTVYEATLRHLDEQECLQPLPSAKTAREDLIRLDAERAQLEERRQKLDSEIRGLESKLGQKARQVLGVRG